MYVLFSKKSYPPLFFNLLVYYTKSLAPADFTRVVCTNAEFPQIPENIANLGHLDFSRTQKMCELSTGGYYVYIRNAQSTQCY